MSITFYINFAFRKQKKELIKNQQDSLVVSQVCRNTHIKYWLFWKILLLNLHRVDTGLGNLGKSWNLEESFSRPGKSWNSDAGSGKSWKSELGYIVLLK